MCFFPHNSSDFNGVTQVDVTSHVLVDDLKERCLTDDIGRDIRYIDLDGDCCGGGIRCREHQRKDAINSDGEYLDFDEKIMINGRVEETGNDRAGSKESEMECDRGGACFTAVGRESKD